MISCFKPAINLLIICDLNQKRSRDISRDLLTNTQKMLMMSSSCVPNFDLGPRP